MSYSFCELSIKIKVPLNAVGVIIRSDGTQIEMNLSLVSDCISLPKIGWRKTRNMAKKINLHPQTKTRI